MSPCAQIEFVRIPCLHEVISGNESVLWPARVNQQTENDRDIELLRRIATGDRDAFAEFYERHSTLMFSVACKILNNSPEAEDVLQEAFIQIWEKSRSFDPKLGKAASWAAILVRNKAIDRIRASARRTKLAEGALNETSPSDPQSESVNENVLGRDEAKVVQSAIDKLPLEQRQAIELAYFSGLTQEEISKKLDTPLGTVKARIRRGLLKMRDKLEGLL